MFALLTAFILAWSSLDRFSLCTLSAAASLSLAAFLSAVLFLRASWAKRLSSAILSLSAFKACPAACVFSPSLLFIASIILTLPLIKEP